MFRGELRRRGHGEDQHEGSYVLNAGGQHETQALLPASSSANSLNSDASSMASMTSRDRTSEFVNAVRSAQGRRMNGGHGQSLVATSKGQHREQAARQAAEFMTIAKSIGRDIASTYAKLEKLTLLARRKTLFDDRPAEIQRLTVIIKDDMNALNQQIGRLQLIAKAQRVHGNQRAHSGNVVVALQSRLANMTNNFKEVLEVRTENLKESRSRQKEMFGGQAQVTSTLPQSALKGFHSGSVLAAAYDDEQSENAPLMAHDQHQTRALMTDQSESYLQSRADAMQNIESTIVELGGIFSQLAHMVKEQEEVMVRIDSNVEDAAMNVEAGHSELLRYFRSVTSNRWLMVKVFGVLIFFFVFFVVFMA